MICNNFQINYTCVCIPIQVVNPQNRDNIATRRYQLLIYPFGHFLKEYSTTRGIIYLRYDFVFYLIIILILNYNYMLVVPLPTLGIIRSLCSPISLSIVLYKFKLSSMFVYVPIRCLLEDPWLSISNDLLP